MRIDKNELFNVLTSLPGALAAPVGVAVLLATAVRQGDPWKIVSFSIYGGTLLLLYAATTLYHALRGRAKPVLRRLDYVAIYLLIAGTYTPFSLVTLRGGWGWTLLGLVWGGAIFGIVQEQRRYEKPWIPPLAIYLGMGWLIVIAIRPLLQALPWPGVAWLAAGGLFYTGGSIFFVLDRRFAWAHGLWHLCVLTGSVSHYLAVLLYVS
jgi:hemolysin III